MSHKVLSKWGEYLCTVIDALLSTLASLLVSLDCLLHFLENLFDGHLIIVSITRPPRVQTTYLITMVSNLNNETTLKWWLILSLDVWSYICSIELKCWGGVRILFTWETKNSLLPSWPQLILWAFSFSLFLFFLRNDPIIFYTYNIAGINTKDLVGQV